MFGSLDISTSALVAQRTRSETIAANLANMSAIQDKNGENNPFRRRLAVFAPGDPKNGNANGVHVREIVEDQRPFKKRFMPGHPLADEKGYVKFPNIDSMMEQINMLTTARAYEANITASEATKSMIRAGMRLLA